MKTILGRATEIVAALSQHKITNVKLVQAKVIVGDPSTGYLKVTGEAPGATRLFVMEYLDAGQATKYAYVLIDEKGSTVLRYDNAPHHPEVATHPHHQHVRGTVKPLQNPRLEEFLLEGIRLIE